MKPGAENLADNAAQNPSPKLTITALLLLCLSSLLLYGNTLSNQFIFDDLPLIVENSRIRNFNNIPAIIGLKTGRPMYRPVRNLTYMVDYSISGLNPLCYHVSNIALHALTAFVVFKLLSVLMGSAPVALAGALLMVSHPVHTDSVAYISGRRDILTTLFYLLGFFCFINYRTSGQKRYSVLTLLCFILAIGSKEMAVTLPCICLLYDFTRLFAAMDSSKTAGLQKLKAAVRELLRRYWLDYLPLVLVGAFFCYYKIFLYYPSLQKSFYGGSAASNFATVIRILVHYGKLLFFPVVLQADYSYNAFPLSYSFLELRVILAAFIVGVSLGLVFSALKTRPWVFFGGMWFFITLLPVCQIFPHHELLAEHYLYLPSVGVIILLAPLWGQLFRRRKKTAVIVLCSILVIFSVRTVHRNRDWQDGMSLWTSVLKTAPLCARAHDNLGTAYLERREYKKALSHYEQAVKLRPQHAIFHNNLGRAYGIVGDVSQASLELAKAIELNPGLAAAYNNMGIVFFQKGQYQKAVEYFKQSIKRKPSAVFCYNFGKTLLRLGNLEEAVKAFQRALRYKPDYVEAYHQLGIAFKKKGEFDRALQAFQTTVSLKPDFAEAYCNMGNLYYFDFKDLAEAAGAYQRGLAINPRIWGAYQNLAAVYFAEGNYKQAAETFEAAFTHGLQEPEIYYKTALLYGQKVGNREKALFYLQKALHLTNEAAQKRKIEKAMTLFQQKSAAEEAS